MNWVTLTFRNICSAFLTSKQRAVKYENKTHIKPKDKICVKHACTISMYNLQVLEIIFYSMKKWCTFDLKLCNFKRLHSITKKLSLQIRILLVFGGNWKKTQPIPYCISVFWHDYCNIQYLFDWLIVFPISFPFNSTKSC